jgi:cell division protein FtsB
MIRNTFPYIVFLLAILIASSTLFSEDGFRKVQSLRQSLKALEQKNEGARQDLEELQGEVLALTSDKRAIEKAARNELSMARDGEIIFMFPEASED